MSGVKRYNPNRLCREDIEAMDAIHRKVMAEVRENQHGIAGERGVRVRPVFPPRGDRAVLQGPDNAAAVVIDNDPQYASEGGDFASRVSIIAGVGGHYLQCGDQIDELFPLYDAAGVYVVQKGDPQGFFEHEEVGLTGEGVTLAQPHLAKLENMDEVAEKLRSDKAKSHVTTLADTVQIVARNGGINLYAGGVGKTLSTGVPNREFLGVNLIYGNKVKFAHSDSEFSLEPLVKGHKLTEVLKDIINRQKELTDLVLRIKAGLIGMNIAFATHIHLPAGPVGGLTPSPQALVFGISQIPKDIYDTLGAITGLVNTSLIKVNMSPVSKGSITSAWNTTN